MKILALDVGAGTKDVLLYDDSVSVENCVKLVLPSPSKVYAERVRQVTVKGRNLLVKGETVGGGVLTASILNHLRSGFKVVMTVEAAYTIRNRLEDVEAYGIKIVKDENELEKFDGEVLELREITINLFATFLEKFNVKVLDVDFVGVGVQDSGVYPKGVENRRFRLQKMKEFLEKNPKVESLAFKGDEVPEFFLRMRSAVKAVKNQLPNAKVLVMDTAPAAILGCLTDFKVKDVKNVLTVNAGNAHTLFSLVLDGEVAGMLEHHTRKLDSGRVNWLVKGFLSGKLKDEDVFNDEGHGLFYLENFKPLEVEKVMVAVTGPNRAVFSNINFKVYFPSPGGDVMMTGTFGLVEAVKRKFLGESFGYK
ncbi:MAG: DUF1786 family protein [Candidatus Bathyarchaeota archaeon]|nr:DUF1786 family protein [Candidatus Bathyarchaeota archaeon]